MGKRYLLGVLIVLLGSLSAKRVLAQFPLEVGFGVDAAVVLMQSRAYGFPDRADNKGAVSVEGAYGYSMYVATFPYEGWGWRAEVSGGVRGQPGSYLADEPGRVSHLYGRARAELLYVTPGWTIVGFGASLTRTGTSYLDYGGTGSYWTPGDRSAFGAHVAWSQLARWYTITFRADLTAVAGWGRSSFSNGGRSGVGRYSEWAIGPSVQVGIPFNRAAWVKGLRAERVIYSPRG